MANYYAATNGLSSNTGTIGSPWDLVTALANSSQTSGDTLWLRGGTYTGKFTSSLTGGTVRSYPGEWAIIDGFASTTLNGAITSSTTSITVTDGSQILKAGWSDEISIDGEMIKFCSKSGNNLTACMRAASGTVGGVATAHSNGAVVLQAGPQLSVSGTNTTYRDFEILHSYAVRSEPATTGVSRGNGVHVTGGGNSFINLIVHDCLQGIFTSSASDNTLIYGVLVYNNGMQGVSGNGLGHGFYLENASGYSRLYESISLNSFNLGMQGFGQTGPYVGGDIQGSVFAGAGSPLGDANYNMVYGPNSQISPTGTVNECHFYRTGTTGYHVSFGYAAGVDVGTFTDNYLGGGETAISIGTIGTSLTLDGNIVHDALINTLAAEGGWTWNNNTYYNTAAGNQKFGNTSVPANQTFATWKADTGFDAASTINSADLPDTVIVRPNTYEIGRANIMVYAASAPASINVDLVTTGLSDNQAYTIKNAFDYSGTAVATGVYDAGSTTISLPLNSAALNVATPTGMGSTPTTTVPNFGLFILIPGAADASAPGTPTGLTAVVKQSNSTTGTFQLAWTLGSGTETSVTVRRIVNGVTTDIPLAADVTSYTDTGQTVGLSYTYAVKASNAAGDSAWSDTAQEVLTGCTFFGAPPSIG